MNMLPFPILKSLSQEDLHQYAKEIQLLGLPERKHMTQSLLCKIAGKESVSFETFEKAQLNRFMLAPASTKYHGNHSGGLFEHSMAVADILQLLTDLNHLSWQRNRSPLLVGFFHDLCKVDKYKESYDNYIYNDEAFPFGGHGSLSALRAQQVFPDLTEEELLCIRFHMGAYETQDWNDYGKTIGAYPNILWTHQADMIASKIMGI